MKTDKFPSMLDCPFCEQAVEIVTLQRDAEDPATCIVMYFHQNGDKHFVTYQPASVIHRELC